MSQFEVEKTKLPGVLIITPKKFGDDRGYFMETYQKDLLEPFGLTREFVQDNESRSAKGVLRGLHFQVRHTQGKLVRVTRGKVFDVAVDVRPGSETFGQWVGAELSEENCKMLWVPEGFAHGFLVLEGPAQFIYKCTDVYDPSAEGGIPWDDPTIAIDWPKLDCDYVTSPKDKLHEAFEGQNFDWAKEWL